MQWTFYEPVFRYEQLISDIMKYSAWTGHRRFAYDLVRFMGPATVVELGTHWGISFFSFCQAAADAGNSAKCYAVDHWQGDPHSGIYSEEVYATVDRIASHSYSGTATLIRRSFDDAAALFPNESIDLLHIDGYHTYEAVLHDYVNWLPKLKQNGVVLFHDIAFKEANFGVYKLWEQLKVHPHLEFDHSAGLGVLFPKGCTPAINGILHRNAEFKQRYSV